MTIAEDENQVAQPPKPIPTPQAEARLNVNRSETKLETIEVTSKDDGAKHHILITTTIDIERLDLGTKVYEIREISVEATYLFGDRANWIGEHISTMGGSYASYNGSLKLTNGGVLLKYDLRGMHLGSYMFNKIVEWAMQLDRNVPILPIALSTVDATPENKDRRNAFYERFGIRFDYRAENGVDKAAGCSLSSLTVADLISRPSLEGITRSSRLEGLRNLAYQQLLMKHEIDRYQRVAETARSELQKKDSILKTAAKYLNWVMYIIIAVVAFDIGRWIR